MHEKEFLKCVIYNKNSNVYGCWFLYSGRSGAVCFDHSILKAFSASKAMQHSTKIRERLQYLTPASLSARPHSSIHIPDFSIVRLHCHTPTLMPACQAEAVCWLVGCV